MDLAALTTIWNTLRERLKDETGLEDEDIQDTLEGETDLLDKLRYLIRCRRDYLSDADALKRMIDEMQERKARFERNAKDIGDAVTNAMQEAGISKLSAPDFSVSVAYGKAPLSGAEKLNPDDLPPCLVRTKKEVDRVALRKTLEEGRPIEGVWLGNPQPYLIVRKA